LPADESVSLVPVILVPDNVNKSKFYGFTFCRPGILAAYGPPALTIAILVNLTFFAIGFDPAGRLRLRNDG
jgi:hypothetical protein